MFSHGTAIMSKTNVVMAVLAALLLAGPASAVNLPNQEEAAKINQLLANYTRSVSDGDRALFESQLLDVNVPFFGVQRKAGPQTLKAAQDYAGFRKAIFESGKKFKQRFSNVTIEQVGNLAQVSLDYETAYESEAYDGKGWKVIHLIKTDGGWKIASEFFTGYP
jgi:hypothetical protein